MNLNKEHKEIEMYRKLMIETGLKEGLTHPNTVALSQKLDKLMNQYQLKDKTDNLLN